MVRVRLTHPLHRREEGLLDNDGSRIALDVNESIWPHYSFLAAMDRRCDDCGHANAGNTSTDVDLNRAYLWAWAIDSLVFGASFSRAARARPLAAGHGH